MTTTLASEKLSTFLTPLGIPANAIQKSVYEKLIQLDFPTTRSEYWKYTRTGKISNSTFRIQEPVLTHVDPSLLVAEHYIVIENGILRTDLSSYGNIGVTVKTIKNEDLNEVFLLNSSVDQDQVFSALNTAYFSEVVELTIGSNVVVEEPLQVLFISTGEGVISNPRLLVHAHKSSSCSIAAQFISEQSKECFTNLVAEFFVDENANLTYHKIQNEALSSFHISTEQVSQGRNSNFKINTVILDGGLVRNNINISVAGENCETHMNGVVISKENQHADNHTFVNHKVANCYSNENYKYILADKSTGVFNGRVIVQKDAQKINAYQKNANILLSDFAQIYSKPELEIYADDVKCSHGSTTGQLDDNAIFYLQTRGLSKAKAKKLLVSAFISEILEQFNDAEQDLITAVLYEKHGWDF